jgi:fatty acid desaturase
VFFKTQPTKYIYLQRNWQLCFENMCFISTKLCTASHQAKGSLRIAVPAAAAIIVVGVVVLVIVVAVVVVIFVVGVVVLVVVFSVVAVVFVFVAVAVAAASARHHEKSHSHPEAQLPGRRSQMDEVDAITSTGEKIHTAAATQITMTAITDNRYTT